MFNPKGLPWAAAVEVPLDVAQAVRLRRVARNYVKKQRGKKGRKWQPRWSCAWFCEASAWLRLVRTLSQVASENKRNASTAKPNSF